MTSAEYDEIARLFGQIAVHAGAPIMAYHAEPETHRRKSDGSPVTDADLASEALILEALAKALPDIPVVSEEAAAEGHIPLIAQRFILVDPLDGTREFVRRRNEFAVNIGLIEDGVAVAGAIFAPALGKLWIGGHSATAFSISPGEDLNATHESRPLATRLPDRSALIAVASRSHPDRQTGEFLARFPFHDRISAGSSLKFCLVAEGKADIYPRFGPTMEWDVAAGHAILRAAGGAVIQPSGETFRYGKPRFESGPFIALARPDLADFVRA